MPIAPNTNTGYADYQRLVNYDSDRLAFLQPGTVNTPQQTGRIIVSRYAYVGLNIASSQNAYVVTMQWFLDAAMTLAAGTRTFVANPQIPANAQLRLLNLGPYLNITTTAIGGLLYRTTLSVWGSNRVAPVEAMPSTATLFSVSGVVIVPAGQATEPPNSYYSGPVLFSTVANLATFEVEVQAQLTDGSFVNIDRWPVGPGDVSHVTLVPLGSWQVAYVNTNAGNNTFSATATPSTTGAS